MTFPDWLSTTEGQDALTEAMFRDRVQCKRALESAWRAGMRNGQQESVTDKVQRIATGTLTEGPQGHYTYQRPVADDLELSMADLPGAIERAYRAGQESVLPRDYQELRAVTKEAVTTAPKPMK